MITIRNGDYLMASDAYRILIYISKCEIVINMLQI